MKARNSYVSLTCGGSSVRGKGGSTMARVHVSRKINAETALPYEKVTFSTSQETDLAPDAALEIGLEKGTLFEAYLHSVFEGALTIAHSQSLRETSPPDMVPKPISLVSSKGKKTVVTKTPKSSGNHPILRTSKNFSKGSESGGPSESHQMIVDKVTMVLMPSFQTSSDLDQDMRDSEDDLEESSEAEELMKQDGLITLDQYQSSHRKKALSRKIIQTHITSHNKER